MCRYGLHIGKYFVKLPTVGRLALTPPQNRAESSRRAEGSPPYQKIYR